MAANEFDLIVLGGGSGGIASANRAASYGAKVAIVERSHLGGTCVNRGCVPKKVMYNAAHIASMLHKSHDYGFNVPADVPFNWSFLVSKRNAYIDRLRKLYVERLEKNNITHLHGTGTFVDAHTMKVNGQQYTAKHIIIATGGQPTMPDIPGIEYAIDSDGFFELTEKPEGVAVIGSGYIGVELAGVLHGLGIQTHILIRGEHPLSRFDDMLGVTLLETMRHQGIKAHTQHQAVAITEQANGKKSIKCQNGSVISDIDAVIMAVGREPLTANLNLSTIGVKTDNQGLIQVDKYQNTTCKGIYAIGDVTDAPALTPVAIAAGRKLCDRLFGKQKGVHLDYDHIPTVVFSHPPIGTIGLSEAEAISTHGEDKIKVYKSRFNPMFDALSDKKIPTAIKLITLGPEEKIIGLHLIGYNADEMLQGFGVAINMGACKKDFDKTVAIHPTSAEELVLIS